MAEKCIKYYKKLSEDLKKENIGFTKKEILKMSTERDKLERSLGGIADMKKIPEMILLKMYLPSVCNQFFFL